jgi:hypothetical protein
MHVAPPPSPGSRIQELGDTLVVRFRPRRFWGEIAFLSLWLAGWTLGGMAALVALTQAGWGGRAFLLLWLCGWAFGEMFVVKAIAWQLRGRELLLVTPNDVEIRREIGRFVQTRRLHALAVDDVRAWRVPTDEDDKPRHDYGLEIVAREETLHVGEGMGEREAEYVAAAVSARVRPRLRWSDAESAFGSPAPAKLSPDVPDEAPTSDLPRAREFRWRWMLTRVAPALVGAILFAVVALTVLPPLRDPPAVRRTVPTHVRAVSTGGPPLRADFEDPRAYAIATTRFALISARNSVDSSPTCDAKPTWTRWSCHAFATSKAGPFAGQRLLYRCFVHDQPQPFGRVVRAIECGPEDPPNS